MGYNSAIALRITFPETHIDPRNNHRTISEADEGRFDIQMLPLNQRLPNILIELKAGKDRSETQLEVLANAALQQMNDRVYCVDLAAVNVTSMIKIGIAFSSKRAHIVAERQKSTIKYYMEMKLWIEIGY